jgi:hypothetical protein
MILYPGSGDKIKFGMEAMYCAELTQNIRSEGGQGLSRQRSER